MNVHILVVWKNNKEEGILCGTYVKFVAISMMMTKKKSHLTNCRRIGNARYDAQLADWKLIATQYRSRAEIARSAIFFTL